MLDRSFLLESPLQSASPFSSIHRSRRCLNHRLRHDPLERGVGRHAFGAHAQRLRCNFDVFDLAGRRRNSKPVFTHAFEMELDCFADLGFDLRDGRSGSHATWKVRYVGRVVAFGLLDHDGVTHMASLLQARLLQDAVLRARCEVIARLARDSDATGLGWVLELAMTSTGCYEMPTILLQQLEDFAHLHRDRIAGQRLSPDDCGQGRETDRRVSGPADAQRSR